MGKAHVSVQRCVRIRWCDQWSGLEIWWEITKEASLIKSVRYGSPLAHWEKLEQIFRAKSYLRCIVSVEWNWVKYEDLSGWKFSLSHKLRDLPPYTKPDKIPASFSPRLDISFKLDFEKKSQIHMIYTQQYVPPSSENEDNLQISLQCCWRFQANQLPIGGKCLQILT